MTATLAAPTAVTAAEVAAARATPAGLAWLDGGGRWRPARHLLHLADVIVQAVAADDGRAAVSMPPRHGKSELTSHYTPAWYLGTHPERQVLLSSYEATFAAEWGRKARDTLAEWGPRLYGVRVHPSANARDGWLLQRWNATARAWVDTGGGMFTAGVGGAMTGRGANLLVIDDPIKNRQEADSPTRRRQVWEWYTAVARTRLAPSATVLVVMTRWHHDDLVGRLQHGVDDDDVAGVAELEADAGDVWQTVNLPALAEDGDLLGRAHGEALWPSQYPRLALLKVRGSVGPRVFTGLYQGAPAPASGTVFERAAFNYWSWVHGTRKVVEVTTPEGRTVRYPVQQLRRFATVDLAISERTSADWTVVATWGLTPDGKLLLLDRVRARTATDHEAMIVAAWTLHKPLTVVGIEATQFQAKIVSALQRTAVPVVALHPDGDKVTRALLAQAYQARTYWPAHATWLSEWEDELTAFPRGAHDDQVDVLSYAAAHLDAQLGATLHVQ